MKKLKDLSKEELAIHYAQFYYKDYKQYWNFYELISEIYIILINNKNPECISTRLIKNKLLYNINNNKKLSKIEKDNIPIISSISKDSTIKNYFKIEFKNTVNEILISTLTCRELKIVEAIFGLNNSEIKSITEISLDFNITEQRVIQIYKRILKKLKHNKKVKYLKDWLVLI